MLPALFAWTEPKRQPAWRGLTTDIPASDQEAASSDNKPKTREILPWAGEDGVAQFCQERVSQWRLSHPVPNPTSVDKATGGAILCPTSERNWPSVMCKACQRALVGTNVVLAAVRWEARCAACCTQLFELNHAEPDSHIAVRMRCLEMCTAAPGVDACWFKDAGPGQSPSPAPGLPHPAPPAPYQRAEDV